MDPESAKAADEAMVAAAIRMARSEWVKRMAASGGVRIEARSLQQILKPFAVSPLRRHRRYFFFLAFFFSGGGAAAAAAASSASRARCWARSLAVLARIATA